MVKSLCTVLRFYTELEECDRCYTTLCHLVTVILCCPIVLCLIPASLSKRRVTCQWLLTGQLLLDLCQACFSQDLDMGHDLPPVGSRNREAQAVVKGLSCTSLSSGVLNRMSSHMCGNWYLPMFLFQDGPFNLLNIVLFIAPVSFCSSLPTVL